MSEKKSDPSLKLIPKIALSKLLYKHNHKFTSAQSEPIS
jgi:hypothetical protein